MKWFFALNQAAPNFEPIAQMIKVAVESARQNTDLEPHFLYDGDENHLTHWLQERSVKVIPCRSALYPLLKMEAEKRGEPNVLDVGAGAFLRTEIPRLASQIGIEDTLVFYTDCDVIFRRVQSAELAQLQPQYFAVAPEGNAEDYTHINTGAMLMNIPGLQKRERAFQRFMQRHLGKLTRASWDQTAYEWFYNPLLRRLLNAGLEAHQAERIYRGLERRGLRARLGWQKLPAAYNWKPYWGNCGQARIIHFHGAKPHERELMQPGKTPEKLQHLLASAKGEYIEMCCEWDTLLAQAQTPPNVPTTHH